MSCAGRSRPRPPAKYSCHRRPPRASCARYEPRNCPEVLTEREIEVLRMLAQGQSNKEIARSLVIGEKTVKTHVSSILGKLGVPSRTQAALYAVRIGLVAVDGHSV